MKLVTNDKSPLLPYIEFANLPFYEKWNPFVTGVNEVMMCEVVNDQYGLTTYMPDELLYYHWWYGIGLIYIPNTEASIPTPTYTTLTIDQQLLDSNLQWGAQWQKQSIQWYVTHASELQCSYGNALANPNQPNILLTSIKIDIPGLIQTKGSLIDYSEVIEQRCREEWESGGFYDSRALCSIMYFENSGSTISIPYPSDSYGAEGEYYALVFPMLTTNNPWN